jgi:RNA polymerase sigma-70 factor (ECF subfamily)
MAAIRHAKKHGNMQQLRSLLAADATAYADGGGKARAPTQPIAGSTLSCRSMTALARIFADHMSRLVRYGLTNGLPGFVTTIEQDNTLRATALQIDSIPPACDAS